MSSFIGKVLQNLANSNTPPVPYASPGRYSQHGLTLRGGPDTYMRAMASTGTVFAIVTLLARTSAKANWRMYRKSQDQRVVYTQRDEGSDTRTEVLKHQALKVFHYPNQFMSRHELVYLTQMWLELAGEAYWNVVKTTDGPGGIPTALWPISPTRMTPVPSDKNFLAGWIYTGPDGDQIPLRVDEIIQLKYPNPLDIHRGLGPVQAVLVDVDASKYSAEWNRNYFLNGAEPGGIIQAPNSLTDEEFNELSHRWREAHQGVNRSHRVAVLENGAQWLSTSSTMKDMDFANLRNVSDDMIRRAWGIHKVMVGVSDDVNRANAQTGEEVHVAWQAIPRLDLIKMTLNHKFLPMFGSTGEGVEFEYHGVEAVDREQDAKELLSKSQSAQFLVSSGYDPADVLSAVGLPPMSFKAPVTAPAAAPDAAQQDAQDEEQDNMSNFRVPALYAKKDVPGRVFQQVSKDYPAAAMGWIYNADWMGPVKVPLNHLDMTGDWNPDPDTVQHFVKQIADKGKTKPVILVKTPSSDKLCVIDGHSRVTAYQAMGEPVRAFVGTVDADSGPWDEMHDQQLKNTFDTAQLTARLQKMLSNGHQRVDVEALL